MHSSRKLLYCIGFYQPEVVVSRGFYQKEVADAVVNRKSTKRRMIVFQQTVVIVLKDVKNYGLWREVVFLVYSMVKAV